ncbi:MAG TPA: LptF/LptG family permease [Deltaproteobacteria bacterium]|jgi:lipopolysaccharide export system permease protein|nr:LptF/LptG family permease [Deltaproteobacteria bacterium]HOI08594.1 LptF/LptG family permease [Deltaproteobacteria bacterium]
MKKALLMSLTALAGLVLLLLISELFGDLTTFAEYRAGVAAVMQYLTFSIPKMVNLVLPFSICLGVLAAQAAFARNSETIAMQACSVSLARIFMPYIAVGVLATVLMSATSFYLYPQGQREADRIRNLVIKKGDVTGSFSLSGGRFKVGQDIYRVASLDVAKGVMSSITAYRFSSGRLNQVIQADEARWDGTRWEAKGLRIMDLGPKGISGPRTASSLPLEREPQDLVLAQTNTEVLPLLELREYVRQLRDSGTSSPTVETLYHSRISFAMAPLIITLLVIPFGMTFPRAGGIAKGISLGLILGLSYWGLHSFMAGLGSSGTLNPLLASWGANITALAVAAVILLRKRRAVYG